MVEDADIAARAAGVLGPESALFDSDPAGFAEALAKALRGALSSPAAPVRATAALAADLARIPMLSAARLFGAPARAAVSGGSG